MIRLAVMLPNSKPFGVRRMVSVTAYSCDTACLGMFRHSEWSVRGAACRLIVIATSMMPWLKYPKQSRR
jgi:hypothetical protein